LKATKMWQPKPEARDGHRTRETGKRFRKPTRQVEGKVDGPVRKLISRELTLPFSLKATMQFALAARLSPKGWPGGRPIGRTGFHGRPSGCGAFDAIVKWDERIEPKGPAEESRAGKIGAKR
jgi:hypothetical protein